MVGALAGLLAAAYTLVARPELHDGGMVAQFALFVAAAVLTRRFGIALPRQGFASFVLGVVLAARLVHGWSFAVAVAPVGLAIGDGLVRRLPARGVFAVAAHLTFGTAAAGLCYTAIGGGTGSEALVASNLMR